MAYLSACQYKVEEDQQVAEKKMRQSAQLNAQLGLAYFKKGNISRAKRKLLYALERDKNSPEIQAAMAFFLEKTGDIEQSMHYYKKALTLAPNSGAQLNNFGAFLCRQKRYDEAEKYFLKAVSDVQYINSGAAYENAGYCQMPTAQYKKALIYFKKALEHDPARLPSLIEAVKIELEFKKPREALALLNQYSELTLKNDVLLQLAVQAAKDAGQYDQEAAYKNSLEQFNLKKNLAGATDEYDSNLG